MGSDENRMKALDEAVRRAAEGLVLWVADVVQAAMRHCNARWQTAPHE